MSLQPILVYVNFYGILREITKKKSEEILLKSFFVEDLLEILSKRYGDSFRRLFFKKKNLQSQITIFINHLVVPSNKISEIKLYHGDQIDLFVPVSGG